MDLQPVCYVNIYWRITINRVQISSIDYPYTNHIFHNILYYPVTIAISITTDYTLYTIPYTLYAKNTRFTRYYILYHTIPYFYINNTPSISHISDGSDLWDEATLGRHQPYSKRIWLACTHTHMCIQIYIYICHIF